MSFPDWLPEMFSVDPWTRTTYDELYEIFLNCFVRSQPKYRKRKVWFFPEKKDGKEKIFWHLTSRDDKETGDRLPDYRRCERLPWVRPMLDKSNRPEILAWDYEEGDGVIKTYVWLEQYDFLVILKKYKDGGRRLLTSFWIEFDSYKKKLNKKYQKRIKCQKG